MPKLEKPLAGAFGGNQSHNSIAFQFCQPPFTGLYPISPRVLLYLTRVLAYFPHILVIQLKVPEFITGEVSVPMDTTASFGTYFLQEEQVQKGSFWVSPMPNSSTPFHWGSRNHLL